MAFVYTPQNSTTYDSLISDTLERLGDLANDVWNRAEIGDYLQDGYDLFCQRTKVLYDIHVIPNIPITGNWSTDLERQLASTKSGFAVTDHPLHFTGEHERNLGTGGRYGASMGMAPTPETSHSPNITTAGLPSLVPGGPLPTGTIEVLDVTYDSRSLKGMTAQQMRDLDPQYETRSGDPQFFIFDTDGIYTLRVVPAALGQATYVTVDGTWGTLVQTDDSTVTVVTSEVNGNNTGGFGIMRYRDDMTFYSGGPWGSATRIHPESQNIEVMTYRLGRPLKHYASELPLPYEKYVMYWAMYQALDREGAGQQLELAQHYKERFEMGVSNMTARKRNITPTRTGSFAQGTATADFALGDAQVPYPYGQTYDDGSF